MLVAGWVYDLSTPESLGCRGSLSIVCEFYVHRLLCWTELASNLNPPKVWDALALRFWFQAWSCPLISQVLDNCIYFWWMYPGKFSLAEQWSIIKWTKCMQGWFRYFCFICCLGFWEYLNVEFSHPSFMLNRYKILPQSKFFFLCFQILTSS